MRLAVFGFAIGLAGAFAAKHVMASLLDEMKRNDPAVVLGTNWGRPGSGGCFGGVFRSSRRAARLDRCQPFVMTKGESAARIVTDIDGAYRSGGIPFADAVAWEGGQPRDRWRKGDFATRIANT
jgi:hypothetical protein